MQVVRSAATNEKGKEVVMFWYLEAIEMPERPHGLFGKPDFACYPGSQCLGHSMAADEYEAVQSLSYHQLKRSARTQNSLTQYYRIEDAAGWSYLAELRTVPARRACKVPRTIYSPSSSI